MPSRQGVHHERSWSQQRKGCVMTSAYYVDTDSFKHSIASLCFRSDVLAREKGWYDGEDEDPRPFGLHIALLHSELSEALEEWRNHHKLDEIYYSKLDLSLEKKPEGIPIELADFVIRICQRMGAKHAGRFQELCYGLPNVELFEKTLADLHVLVSLSYNESSGESSTASIKCLASAVQLTFAFAKACSFDLWDAILKKEAYNRTRPHRHGGKKA